MRHDLPNKIQLSAPKTPWWKSEPVKQLAEFTVLCAAFVAGSLIIRGLI
jgi:hypothetical protein